MCNFLRYSLWVFYGFDDAMKMKTLRKLSKLKMIIIYVYTYLQSLNTIGSLIMEILNISYAYFIVKFSMILRIFWSTFLIFDKIFTYNPWSIIVIIFSCFLLLQFLMTSVDRAISTLLDAICNFCLKVRYSLSLLFIFSFF